MLIQPRPLCATGTRCCCMIAQPAAKKAWRGLLPDLKKLEAEGLGGGAPTLLLALEFLFVETRLV